MTGIAEQGPPAVEGEAVGRWLPDRAGILNVWRYYQEVFTFHRGRLLLRGRNGTGKSKCAMRRLVTGWR